MRYSLRTLLTIILLVAMLLGMWARRAVQQRRAVVAIRATFSEVFYDLNQSADGTFDRAFQRTSRVPSWLIERMGIDYFHPVDFVVFDSPRVTDDTLAQVRDLPNLKRVAIIEGAMVTSEGLVHLKLASGLEYLVLCLDDLNDAGLANVSELAKLERLEIFGEHGSITDGGLQQLDRLNRLRECYVDIPQISDAGRERLQRALPNCKMQ